jgi:hypothetical protein
MGRYLDFGVSLAGPSGTLMHRTKLLPQKKLWTIFHEITEYLLQSKRN